MSRLPKRTKLAQETAATLKEWIADGILGSPFPGVRPGFLASDWEASACHAGDELMRGGHRVIGVLEPQGKFPGVLSVERGLEPAMSDLGGAGRLLLLNASAWNSCLRGPT